MAREPLPQQHLQVPSHAKRGIRISNSRRLAQQENPVSVGGFLRGQPNRQRRAGKPGTKKTEGEFGIRHKKIAPIDPHRKKKAGGIAVAGQTQPQFNATENHQRNKDHRGKPKEPKAAFRGGSDSRRRWAAIGQTASLLCQMISARAMISQLQGASILRHDIDFIKGKMRRHCDGAQDRFATKRHKEPRELKHKLSLCVLLCLFVANLLLSFRSLSGCFSWFTPACFSAVSVSAYSAWSAVLHLLSDIQTGPASPTHCGRFSLSLGACH